MKTLFIAVMLLVISFVGSAQDTLSSSKNINGNNEQKAQLDYFLKIKGIDGDSDSLPPAPTHLSISAGGTMSQTSNSNFISRYTVQSKPGFAIGIAYTWEFSKGRFQVQAGYQKGGVNVATGDVNGDGKENTTNVNLDYLTVPVQYQFYLGKRRQFFAGLGGYASFLLSSKQAGNPVYEEGLKSFDAGGMASIGIWIGSRIMLQSGYNFGLVDIDVSSDNSARNGMAFLTLSYSLTPRLKYGPIIKIKPKGG